MNLGATTYEANVSRNRRETLILEHLDYVKHILGKMLVTLPKFVDRENLEAAGVLGLVEAAQAYDPDHGTQFKTFAFQRIRGAIIDELRRNCPIPQHLLQKISQLKRILEQDDPHASPEMLAQSSGFSMETVEQCLEAMRLLRPTIWDDMRMTVPNTGHPAPDQRAAAAEMRQRLVDQILALPEQERLVISLYYLEDLRLKEIGKLMSLSEARISRILSKAEFRLRQSL